MNKIVFVLGALLISTSAFASDFRFAYDPGELSTPAKSAAFHARLENAARDYCVNQHMENGASTEAHLHAHHQHFEQSCVTDLVSKVVERIGDKGLLVYRETQSSSKS